MNGANGFVQWDMDGSPAYKVTSWALNHAQLRVEIESGIHNYTVVLNRHGNDCSGEWSYENKSGPASCVIEEEDEDENLVFFSGTWQESNSPLKWEGELAK